jgi:hypothetical protein
MYLCLFKVFFFQIAHDLSPVSCYQLRIFPKKRVLNVLNAIYSLFLDK